MTKFYDDIEEPIRNLVKLLRENGFNTLCSCGHYPYPYIEMEWYHDDEITKLYELITINGYRNFIISGRWHNCNLCDSNERILRIEFHVKIPLAKDSDLKS